MNPVVALAWMATETVRDLVAGRPAVARDPGWSRLRARWLKAHPRCAVCDTTKKVEVHHVEPVHLFPDREMDAANLVSLCRLHHFEVGHLGLWVAYNRFVAEDVAFWRGRREGRMTQ